MNKSYVEDLMYGRRKSLIIGPFLRLLSLFYGLIVLLRLGLFAVGIFRRKKVAQRVISVGNVTLGGTGKTPAVIQIASVLLKYEKRPAVITRGYGRRDESSVVVVSDGTRVAVDTKTGGDEPVLIGSKLPGVPVVAGGNRFQSALFAHEKFSNDTVILDDGFQHVRLRRDLDIVLIDAADPFGNGKLFPAGVLREPLFGLRRAHIVLITRADRTQDIESLKRSIRTFTSAAIFTSRQVPCDLVDIMTGEIKPLAALRGTTVLAFSGIARPAAFTTLLRSLEADIRAQFAFPDHYDYKKTDLARLFQKATDDKISMIVTTEKDAVRLKNLKPEGIWALRIELKIVENEEWEAVLLNRI